MALNIPSYPNKYSTEPALNAYAWIMLLSIDFNSAQGRIQVGINLDQASADALLPTIDTFSVALGEDLGNDTTFPDLTAIVTNAAIAAASDNTLTPFDAIRKALYDTLLNHPKLVGSTEI